MNKTHTIIRKNNLFYLVLLSAMMVVGFSSCNKKVSLEEQPLLDSVYITQFMKGNPEFRDHLISAKNFYRERGFKLGWFKDHKLVPQADRILDVIKRAGEEGLDPKDYQLVDFDSKLKELDEAKRDTAKFKAMEKEIDLSLSATYFNWASDYYRGLVIPKENKQIEWDVKRNKIKLHKTLLTFLGERESKYPYDKLAPLHPAYANLKKALARYRQIQKSGGWPQIPSGTQLKEGQTSPVVSPLRKRLSDYADAQPQGTDSVSNVFDANLTLALKRFQENYGLNPSGKLNSETISKLNRPIQEDIRKIIINMERWRWIPKSFEQDYVIVNIPEYKLRVYEKGRQVMDMKVIVGKEMHNTPIFSDKMEYVVLAPHWNIPPNILKDEIVPRVMQDPSYLDRMNIEVVTEKGSPVDPGSVDWSQAGEPGFKYVVRKKPGPENDLGDVKFIFPNTNDIYLHDTPHDQLFSQAKRGFSHGCVRVERPLDLASYLLGKVGWNRSRIMQQISTQEEKFVPLKAKLPVYLVYFTAAADSEGRVRFFDDIYGHDRQLAAMYFSKL